MKKSISKIKYLTKNPDLDLHSLRHNLNSYLIKNNVSPVKICKYFGWSSEVLDRTQRGYTHLDYEDMIDIADQIDYIFDDLI